MTDLTRTRGDTIPIELAVTDDSGAAVDVTGFSFVLTADPSDKPKDASNNIFALTGTITDAANGLVEFDITATQADQVGIFFYDVEQTDTADNKQTIASGKITFKQDISK